MNLPLPNSKIDDILARSGDANAKAEDKTISTGFLVPSHLSISNEALRERSAISIGNAHVSEKMSIGMKSDIITTPVIILVFIFSSDQTPPKRLFLFENSITAESTSCGLNSGHIFSEKYSSEYADCHIRKFEMRYSAPVRMIRSGSGQSHV